MNILNDHLPALSRIIRILHQIAHGNAGVIFENRFRSKKGLPRLLLRHPNTGSDLGYSVRRINLLLERLNGNGKYLEVGVSSGTTLEQINSRDKYGVDPEPQFDLSRLPSTVTFYHGTSDQFFESVPQDKRWDVIFVDGLHTYEQTYRDLLNSLCHLKPGGAILIDDTVPSDEISAIPDLEESTKERLALGLTGLPWHGDVWKVVIAIARNHPELDYRTLVGSGNPQTLLWRRNAGQSKEYLPYKRFLIDPDVEKLSYHDVFGNGIPSTFRPVTESEGIADYRLTTARGTEK